MEIYHFEVFCTIVAERHFHFLFLSCDASARVSNRVDTKVFLIWIEEVQVNCASVVHDSLDVLVAHVVFRTPNIALRQFAGGREFVRSFGKMA